MNNIGKILIVFTLIIIVGFVIIFKEKLVKKNDVVKVSEPEKVIFTSTKQEEISSNKIDVRLEKDILAIVEGEEITKKELESEYYKLSPKYRDQFKNDKDGYLEQMIIKKLLFQQAQKEGLITRSIDEEKQRDEAIHKLFTHLSSEIDIPKQKLIQFYEQNKTLMQGASFDQVENDIRSYVAQQKQNELIEEYVKELRANANVTLNEKWIEEQFALRSKNLLTDALKNGLPTVLDLVSDSCIPCQMMMPIFDELEKELKGKANVLLLQISDYRALANEYKVRVIPTQIFFDQNGKQQWRHEGFLTKEDILKKMREIGADL